MLTAVGTNKLVKGGSILWSIKAVLDIDQTGYHMLEEWLGSYRYNYAWDVMIVYYSTAVKLDGIIYASNVHGVVGKKCVTGKYRMIMLVSYIDTTLCK